ncbi:hypothetical protein PRNP1_009358 [Phytophthora ramorum]
MAKRSASPSAVRPPRERTMLMAQFKQEMMEIYLKDATRAEIMAIRREILLRGRNVRDFRVKIGKPGSSFGNSDFLIPTKETELLLFNMDLDALFVHLPKLRRLDLKLVPLGSGHLPPILVAAGKFCLQMEVLVLPRKIKLEVVAKGSRIETMLKAVYSSLERCGDVMCTGNGIFEYLRRVLGSDTTNGDWRELTLRLGGQANGNSGLPSFYREIATLLRLLSKTSEETFGAASNKQKFEVYLVNPLRSMVSRQWGATYMREQLIPLINSVRKVHPTLKATAYLNGKSGDSFKRFDRLNLIWRPDYSDSGLFVNEEEYNLFYDPSVEGREAAALSFPEPVAASTDEAPRIDVFGRLTYMFDELLGPTVHNDYEESSDEDEE